MSPDPTVAHDVRGREPDTPTGADVAGIGLVVASFDGWSDVRFGRHQLVARMLRRFPVVWMNPAHVWRETPRVLFERLSGKSHPVEGPIVHDARLWEPRLRGNAGLWTVRQRLLAARRALASRGCSRYVLYTFRPMPELLACGVPFDLTCYHVHDEHFASPDGGQDPQEREFISRVDQVFVHSQASLDKKSGLNPHMRWVPNGVDYDAYATPVPEPADLAAIPRPRIGYSGNIKQQLDWPLIETLVERHADWSFVFVGQVKNLDAIGDRVRALRRRPNVHFLGKKSFDELARYPQHFDVATMPYTIDHYTRFIYPLKLHEYHAAGRPIVSTAVPAVEPHAGTVTIATGVDEWSLALRAALEPEADTELQREERRNVAREFDWDSITSEILSTITTRLRT